MNNSLPKFYERIKNASTYKESRIILALDILPRSDLKDFAKKVITLLEEYICAIKVNFHLILPLSSSDILEINEVAHSYGLQSIADIKLNDISSTNEIAIDYLLKMGFDAVVINPFVGKTALQLAVKQAHRDNCGIIALVYMSYAEARESFGIKIINTMQGRNKIANMYNLFLHHAYLSAVDGIVIGATQTDILREIYNNNPKKIPIYSPGIGAQGGNIIDAAKNGTDFFIVGRSIINSKYPIKEVIEIKNKISGIYRS